MALSDCSKCWDTPCSCGFGYKEYDGITLSKYIASITQYRPKHIAIAILEAAIEQVEGNKGFKENI